MQAADWNDPNARVLGCLIGEPGTQHGPLLLLVNAEVEDATFTLPAGTWKVALDTSDPRGIGSQRSAGNVAMKLPASSLLLLALAKANIGL
jgi:pullulanase/glycogen debranching enzyme